MHDGEGREEVEGKKVTAISSHEGDRSFSRVYLSNVIYMAIKHMYVETITDFEGGKRRKIPCNIRHIHWGGLLSLCVAPKGTKKKKLYCERCEGIGMHDVSCQ